MVDHTRVIEACIGDLVKDYHKQKFAYIWEEEFHARLYMMLFEKLQDDPQFRGNTYLDPYLNGKGESVALHCNAKITGTKQHMDIAFWDLASPESYDAKKIDWAIEIKYNWEKSLTESLQSEIKKDLRKVMRAGIKQGYFLCFLARHLPRMQDPEKGKWDDLLRKNGRESYVIYVVTPWEGYRLQGTTWENIL